MKTYVCGNCGKRFACNDVPKGCPVCWSEHVTLVTAQYRASCKEEAIKKHTKACEKLAEQIREINRQRKKLLKEYQRHYQCLYSQCVRGNMKKEDIPRI